MDEFVKRWALALLGLYGLSLGLDPISVFDALAIVGQVPQRPEKKWVGIY